MEATEARGVSFERFSELALALPGVEAGPSFGTPGFRVRKKFLARVKDADTVVLARPLEEKELLMEAAPDIYFETDHYRGWPAILAARVVDGRPRGIIFSEPRPWARHPIRSVDSPHRRRCRC